MIERQPHFPGGDADDRIVVEEMLRDSESGQWYECREFVKKLIQIHARNIPRDHWEDIIQEAMIRVGKSLPTFQYHCSLRTWLFNIVRSCIIDTYRKLTHPGQPKITSGEFRNEVEHESDVFNINLQPTAEDDFIIQEELRNALMALQDYVSTHANPKRNMQILDMVIFGASSLEAAAKEVGCSAAVAGYVVRSAQRYVRERLGYPP
jgi:RNA polymerase sigma factor (sigma-70 family)